MNKTKICFIGCGDHANRYIYPSLASVSTAKLQAVCSLNMEGAESTRIRHGAEFAYSDYTKMIEEQKPDGVIIVGPPQLHFDAGMHCILNHIPFYIEKPPGKDLEQATRLAEASAAAGSFGQVGFMMRHSAVMGKVHEIAQKERLGRVLHGTVNYFTSGPYRSEEIYGMPGTDDHSYLWRYLLVQGIHPVNLAASFLDEITDIEPEVIFSAEDIVIDIKLKDCSGSILNVLLHTLVAPGYGNLQFSSELIYENRAMIQTSAFDELHYFPAEPPTDYLQSDNGACTKWRFATFGNNNIKMGYETEVLRFVESIDSNTPSITDLSDGLKTMTILTKVYNHIKGKKYNACKDANLLQL